MARSADAQSSKQVRSENPLQSQEPAMCRCSAILRIIFAASLLACLLPARGDAQNATVPPARDLRIHTIVDDVSAERIERDIRTLAGFGTRNTLSDTLSPTRGIGAARRWIKGEFDRISAECGGCLEVSYQPSIVKARPQGSRDTIDVNVVNVIAILRGRSEEHTSELQS